MVAKPDALQRRLLGDIIQRFERRGFKLVAMKLLQVPGPAGSAAPEPGAGVAGVHCPGVTVTASGRPEARGPALRAAAAEALLPLARRLHDLGAGGGHGEGTVRGSRGARVRRGDSAVPVPQVWEGYNVVRCTRAMVGDSSAVGTIRGDLSVHITR